MTQTPESNSEIYCLIFCINDTNLFTNYFSVFGGLHIHRVIREMSLKNDVTGGVALKPATQRPRVVNEDVNQFLTQTNRKNLAHLWHVRFV
jgi:hypothetical protein